MQLKHLALLGLVGRQHREGAFGVVGAGQFDQFAAALLFQAQALVGGHLARIADFVGQARIGARLARIARGGRQGAAAADGAGPGAFGRGLELTGRSHLEDVSRRSIGAGQFIEAVAVGQRAHETAVARLALRTIGARAVGYDRRQPLGVGEILAAVARQRHAIHGRQRVRRSQLGNLQHVDRAFRAGDLVLVELVFRAYAHPAALDGGAGQSGFRGEGLQSGHGIGVGGQPAIQAALVGFTGLGRIHRQRQTVIGGRRSPGRGEHHVAEPFLAGGFIDLVVRGLGVLAFGHADEVGVGERARHARLLQQRRQFGHAGGMTLGVRGRRGLGRRIGCDGQT